jgi:Uma2 family endonuclease
MTTHATIPAIEDDIRFYPNHEEDDVPEGTLHERWSDYLVYALDARLPDRFVAGNICVYWERGNNRDYVSPDAFVAEGPAPEPPPRVYRTWLLPRVSFAAEIGSKHNTRQKLQAKRRRYAQYVQPLELLETDPRDEDLEEVLTLEHLHFYRLTEQGYEEVEREANGRFRSAVLGLEIGVDEADNLRLYGLEGERVRTYEEAEQALLAAVQQARAAGARADEEARARMAAEQRAEQEARARAASEQRAAEERAQRVALERELAALRARLAGDDV